MKVKLSDGQIYDLFSGEQLLQYLESTKNLPTTTVTKEEVDIGISIVDLLVRCKLCKSKNEARQLIKQGAIKISTMIGGEKLLEIVDKNDIKN